LIALPIGVLIALFLTEFASPRWAGPVRLALDLLYGLPSIVIALFLYGLLVVGHGQAGVYASLALAIIMVPLIARTTGESLGSCRRSSATHRSRSASAAGAPRSG
jgi:phosphate transport system permease protein